MLRNTHKSDIASLCQEGVKLFEEYARSRVEFIMRIVAKRADGLVSDHEVD